MIMEALRLFNTLLSMLGELRQPLANLVMKPLLTVGLLLGLYAGWHVRDEGDLLAGCASRSSTQGRTARPSDGGWSLPSCRHSCTNTQRAAS
jgi:hypothetical protein